MLESPPKRVGSQEDVFWTKLEQWQQGNGHVEPEWLRGLRRGALARFAETGFPTLRDEDWRFTNVAPITKAPFNPILAPAPAEVSENVVAAYPFNSLQGTRLVFVDGHFIPELSSTVREKNGIQVLGLAQALSKAPQLVENHFENCDSGGNAFTALNAAFFTDGAVIYVPAKAVLAEPVQLLHIGTSEQPGATAHLRHLIVLEAGAKATVLENYTSLSGATRVTNVVTELVLGAGSKMEHCKFQEESATAYHVAMLRAGLGRSADFIAHSFALGARISRNNIRTVLAGEGVECVLNGLYLTKDDQLADHHMIVEHAQPHCNSHEYFNGILDGKSRGVFHGRILVRPDAQKTDAKQTNKNLLLSDDAGVNTKPQLEIYADDVKCTHGATIGQLNEESVFYLQARGIGRETARRMLMHAFAAEIIERIRHEQMREELDQLVWNRLEQNEQITMAS
jgi:Fe-S cluster assembly protein SufD